MPTSVPSEQLSPEEIQQIKTRIDVSIKGQGIFSDRLPADRIPVWQKGLEPEERFRFWLRRRTFILRLWAHRVHPFRLHRRTFCGFGSTGCIYYRVVLYSRSIHLVFPQYRKDHRCDPDQGRTIERMEQRVAG